MHQLSGCLTNRTMCSSKYEKVLSSDVCKSDCVSELKEKLCVKTMCAKEPPPEIPSKNSDVTSELPPQICLLIGWGQRVGSKWGLLEEWLYKRHPISQERYREREREKGSPYLLLQLAVCLKKEKSCCAQCLFVGKISVSCTFTILLPWVSCLSEWRWLSFSVVNSNNAMLFIGSDDVSLDCLDGE